MSVKGESLRNCHNKLTLPEIFIDTNLSIFFVPHKPIVASCLVRHLLNRLLETDMSGLHSEAFDECIDSGTERMVSVLDHCSRQIPLGVEGSSCDVDVDHELFVRGAS